MPTRQPACRFAVGPLAAQVLFASAVGAQGSRVDLVIDCPALDEASRAVLEARSRAELTSAPLPPGEVGIGCARDTATLVWRPNEGTRRQSLVRIGPESAAAVDTILSALDQLLFEKPAPEKGADGAASDAPPVSTAASTVRTASTPPAPALRPVEPPEPPQMEAITPRLASSYGIGFAAGGDAELWSGAVLGAMGFHADAHMTSPRRWSVVLGGGALWPSSSPQSIRSQLVRAFAGLEYDLASHVLVGASADARVLLAAEGSLPVSQAATAGLVVSVRYAANLGPLRLSAGPQGELLVRPIIVEEAGSEVFRVPGAIVGIALEASGDVAGTR